MALPFVPPPGQPGGGDSGARANGFSDYSAYQQAVARQNSSGGGNTSSPAPASNTSDPIALAKQAQQMQVDANQPAITTLQTSQNSLQSQYQKLLDSITTAEQPALNSVIGAANTNLAKRGITSDSAYGAMNIGTAQLPVASQFGQLLSSTGVSEQNDLNTLASQIASLQAGNAGNALNFSSGINSANLGLQAAQVAATAKPFTPVAPGQTGINQITGQIQVPSFLS